MTACSRLVAVLLLSAALASLPGCGGDDAGDGTGLRVVATIAPAAALVLAVGGDLIRLTTLAPSGVDPHDYEVSASDRRAVAQAAVVFRIGLGIDAFLDKVLDGRGKVVTLSDGLTLRYGRTAGGQPSAEPDPHVWHDAGNDRLMVGVIAATLAGADAANAELYRRNADAYVAKLEESDREVRALIDTIPAANRKIVTNHDALGYFFDRYQLTFVGAVIPNLTTQAEPSARDLAALVETIRREGVKAIFAESTVDPKVARRIAADTGVKVVDNLYGDSLGPPGSGAETVDGMLLANARSIAGALR